MLNNSVNNNNNNNNNKTSGPRMWAWVRIPPLTHFIPLVVETFGGWSDRAIRVIRRLGKLQGSRLGVDQAMATRHLFQRLSVSLWRGNANLWASRLPFFSPSVDGIR